MSLSPFEAGHKEALPRILVASVAFHLALVVAVVIASWSLQDDAKPAIPVFELVQVEQPTRTRGSRPRPPEPRPEPPPVQPEPKPELKPIPKPQPTSKPEPKPQLKPVVRSEPSSKTEPAPKESAPAAPEPSMDMPSDTRMDMPDFGGMQSLRPVGMVDMDPLLQVYLERLVSILMQNFNPPSGTAIKRGTKTSVQFTIERSGAISGIVLRSSSGNAVWDRLSMRAVQIARVPPLPPNYRAPVLPLVFDFREK